MIIVGVGGVPGHCALGMTDTMVMVQQSRKIQKHGKGMRKLKRRQIESSITCCMRKTMARSESDLV